MRSLPVIRAILSSHGESVRDLLEALGANRSERWPEVMKVTTACAYLDMGRSRLYELMDTGQIPFFYDGRDRKMKRSELDTWIQIQAGTGGVS